MDVLRTTRLTIVARFVTFLGHHGLVLLPLKLIPYGFNRGQFLFALLFSVLFLPRLISAHLTRTPSRTRLHHCLLFLSRVLKCNLPRAWQQRPSPAAIGRRRGERPRLRELATVYLYEQHSVHHFMPCLIKESVSTGSEVKANNSSVPSYSIYRCKYFVF